MFAPRSKHLAAALSLGLLCTPLLADSTERTHKQRYTEAMSFQADAPDRATELLRQLAEDGYPRAMERLAYFTFKGIGTEKDVQGAIALYQQAVDAGRTNSLVSLGKVQMTNGNYAQAIAALTEGSRHGHLKADAVLAWAHATGRLGALSLPVEGFNDLSTLAQADQREAQMYLLDAAGRTGRKTKALPFVLERLHTRHSNGDAKAAEALLRFYRAQPHPKGTLKMRAALLQTEGLRDKIRVEEGLYLAAALTPKSFWRKSEDLVRSATPPVYARALSVTARINRNAYVRLVQQDLRALGYKVGRPSPYMNKPLIRAINRFCRDTGLNDACRLGPLKSVTIKAVAGKLAEIRQSS